MAETYGALYGALRGGVRRSDVSVDWRKVRPGDRVVDSHGGVYEVLGVMSGPSVHVRPMGEAGSFHVGIGGSIWRDMVRHDP